MTPVNAESPTSLSLLATEIMAAHTAAVGASRVALDHARRAGDLLLQAKAQLRHGEWLPWLAANCDLTLRNAQVYMQIARGWSRLEEHRNAYPDTHFDMTTARQVLAGTFNPAEDGGDAGDVAGVDDVDDDGADDDGDDDADGDDGGCDAHIKKVFLVFTTATLPPFRAELAAVSAELHIDADNDTDRIRALVAYMHDLLFRRAEAA